MEEVFDPAAVQAARVGTAAAGVWTDVIGSSLSGGGSGSTERSASSWSSSVDFVVMERTQLRSSLASSVSKFVAATNEMAKATNQGTEQLLRVLSDSRRELQVARNHGWRVEIELTGLRTSAG